VRFLSLSILLLIALPARAEQRFDCGAATVSIAVVAREGRGREDRVESVLTVAENGAKTVLRYRYIDFIGGACVPGRDGAPLVVFQAYCGGSACRDLDNWGVVDVRTRRVLLAPDDGNRARAERLAGPLPRLEMLSVQRELAR
jgi:hypothetical protein